MNEEPDCHGWLKDIANSDRQAKKIPLWRDCLNSLIFDLNYFSLIILHKFSKIEAKYKIFSQNNDPAH